VLHDVSLAIRPGEVVSLIGENGAGKSTLAKIIAGVTHPTAGTLTLRGAPVSFSHPREALDARIGMVHQELNLAENLTVTENLLLGREPRRKGLLDRAAMRHEAKRALTRLNLSISPDTLVAKLSTAQRQMVEIARALSCNAELLIFDEPTSSLSEEEGRLLLNLIMSLKAQGVAILYVSHRLPEVQQVSDRIVALRDGKNSGTAVPPNIHRNSLIQMIVGREITDIYGYEARPRGDDALTITSFQATSWHAPCSFSVGAGEIVGIAGLVGSGRTELLESIFGVTQAASGALAIKGTPTLIDSPAKAWRAGIALVPESRKEQGLLLDASIRENIILSEQINKSPITLRDQDQERESAVALITSLQIKCRGSEDLCRNLSGGNQQKVVIAKCLHSKPSVLLLDEPTRGVDVGARGHGDTLRLKRT
jgi:ribose transport system ATP-binding protein